VVLLILIWWGYQLMIMHVDFGQRLADQADGRAALRTEREET